MISQLINNGYTLKRELSRLLRNRINLFEISYDAERYSLHLSSNDKIKSLLSEVKIYNVSRQRK